LSGKATVIESTQAPGKYKLRLDYIVPAARGYELKVGRNLQVVELNSPLDMPAPAPAPVAPPDLLDGKSRAEECRTRLAESFGMDETERQVRNKFDSLKDTAGLLVKNGSCTQDEADTAISSASGKITLVLGEPISIAANEVVKVEVIRFNPDGSRTLVQEITYKGQGSGKGDWLVLYGFNFVKDEDEKYFTKENTGDGSVDYVITRERNGDGSVLAPSVYFMYLPAKNDGWLSPISWRKGNSFGGVSSGLGFDQSNPNVFLGYGIGWGSNVMVTAGLVYRRVQRLSGRYGEGEVVPVVLTNDLVDETYKPAAYVGVAFRFGANPFSGSKPAAQ